MTSIISLALREWKGIVIIFLECSTVSNPVQEKQNLLLQVWVHDLRIIMD